MARFETKITADTSQFFKAIESVVDGLEEIEKLANKSLNPEVNVDSSGFDEAKKKLEDLEKNVTAKVGADDSELDGAKKKVEDLDGSSAEVNVKASGLDSLGSGLTDAFSGGFIGSLVGGGLAGLAEAGIGAIVDGLGAAVDAGLELNRALGDLEAKTGATGQQLADLGQAAERAFLDGVGGSLAEATDIIAEAQIRLGDFLNPEELGAFTGQAQALANTFDLDVNEVLAKSEPLIKQFGLSGQEAFETLAGTLQNASTAQDDVLDTFAEYSQLAVEAGFNAQEFGQKLITAGEDGAFNLDKVADTIKEAQIRINAGDFSTPLDELSASASGAEKAVIDTVNSIAQQAQRGDISIKDALQLSGEAIQDAVNAGEISNSLASQLQVAIAGTPAEDLGVELYSKVFAADVPEDEINKTFQDAGNSISKAIGQYTSFEEVTRQFQLVFEKVSAGFINFADTFIAPVIGGVLEILGSIKDAFVDAFGGLGDIFEGSGAVDYLELFQGYISALVTFLEARIVPTFEFAFGFIANILESVLDALSPLFDLFSRLGDLFSSISTETTGFREILSQVADVLAEVGGFLFDLLIAPLEITINLFTSVVTTIADFVAGLFGATDATSIFNDVIEFLSESLTNIQGTIGGVRAAFDALIDAISNFDITEALKALVSGENPFAGITDEISDAYDKGFNEATGKYEDSAEEQKKISDELYKKLNKDVEELAKNRENLSKKELIAAKKDIRDRAVAFVDSNELLKRDAQKLENALNQIKIPGGGDDLNNNLDKAKDKVKDLGNVFSKDFQNALKDAFQTEPFELDLKLPDKDSLNLPDFTQALIDGTLEAKELDTAITGITFNQEQIDKIDAAIDKLELANAEIQFLNEQETPQFFKALNEGQEEFISNLSNITNESDKVLKELESKKSGLQKAFLGSDSEQERQQILKQINDLNSQIIDRTIETANITVESRKNIEDQYQLFRQSNEKQATQFAVDELDKQLKANQEFIEKLKGQRKEYVQDQKGLEEEQIKIAERLSDRELSENERQLNEELAQLAEKYNKELQLVGNNEQLKNDLIKAFYEDREKIAEDFAEREAQEALRKFRKSYGEIYDAIENIDVSGVISNNKDIEQSLEDLEKTYEEDTQALQEQLRNKEISQEEYYDRLRDLEEDYNEQSRELNDERIGFFETFGIAVSGILQGVAEQFRETFDDLAKDIVTFKGTTTQELELIGDALTVVGASVAAELGAALAEGELTFGKFIVAIIDGVQAAITALLAQLIMQKEIQNFIPGVGTAGALAIYGVATGLLQAAKAAFGGAEEGVIGLSEGNKGKPGKTDTIPMMLAPGESVISAQATKGNEAILNAINSGVNWEDYAINSGVLDKYSRKELNLIFNKRFPKTRIDKQSVSGASMRGVEQRLDRLEGAIRGQTKKIKADVRQVGKTTNKVDVNIRSNNYLY